MRPLTDAIPKEMLPLGRRSALQHVVFELEQAGIHQIVFVVSPRKEPILRAAFAGSDRPEAALVQFAVQTEMRGLGDALLCAAPFIPEGEAALVALGDAVIAEQEPGGLTRRLLASAADVDPAGEQSQAVGLVVHRVPRRMLSRYGVVAPIAPEQVGDGPFFAIHDIVEKPSPESTPSEFAAAARYRLPYAVFDTLRKTAPDAKGEVQLTDAMRALLREGHPGIAVPLASDEKRHDIGGFDSYYRAFLEFALADGESGAALRNDLIESIMNTKEPTVE